MKLQCKLIHDTAGRSRFHLTELRYHPEIAGPLLIALRSQHGVHKVRVNSTALSIVVTHDSNQQHGEDLLRFIHSLSLLKLKRSITLLTQSDTKWVWPFSFELTTSSLGLAARLVSPALAVPALPVVLGLSACSIFKRAADSLLRKRKLNVDVLDASATSLLALKGDFTTALFMVWLVNLADAIRDKTVEQSKRSIEELVSFNAEIACILQNGCEREVRVSQVKQGDTVIVSPGELVPVDGTIISGVAWVDERTITGESQPVEKYRGLAVLASTVVLDGKIHIKTEKVGAETEAAKIVRLIEEAPAGETRAQNYAERWADRLVPFSLASATAVYAATRDLARTSSVLIPDYGTGIRVAAPTSVLAAIVQASRQGILVKGGRHLEKLAEIDCIVFDKTGTLTEGAPQIEEIICLTPAHSEDEILRIAASAEHRLKHPVANALLKAAQARHLSIPGNTDARLVVGLGVKALVEGQVVLVGSERFIRQENIPLTPTLEQHLQTLRRRAVSVLLVAIDGRLAALISYADTIRPESPAVISELRRQGIKHICILTGDHPAVARQIALKLGVDHVVAEILPDQKLEEVKKLQEQGYRVGFVGDGINDSPALAQADVGIAVNGGADIAREVADVVLHTDGLWHLPRAFTLARETVALIAANWRIIVVPNTAVLSLACFGLIGPVAATLISNGAALIATLNAVTPLFITIHGSGTLLSPNAPERAVRRQETANYPTAIKTRQTQPAAA